MSEAMPTRERIVEFLQESTKPVHAGELAKHFGVPKRAYHQLVALLAGLAQQRAILNAGGERYKAAPVRDPADSWNGTLTVNPRGFGFVASPGRPDVFVAAEALCGAFHGDTVTVQSTRTTSRGTEGVVVAVVTRRILRVAGVVRVKRRSAWMDPDDTRVRGPLNLVGDLQGARDGDAAVAEIVRFPEDTRENAEAKLVAVLGTPGEANVEVAKIKIREQIEEEHPAAAISEAEKLAIVARRLVLGTRRDLRDIPFLTIDPADARDHDDAVWATRTDNGFRAYVAIADVSAYVEEGTALDQEALKRGCTIYLPDRAIPMLPGVLAADLCSLLPDKERYCLCVVADLDDNCNVTSFEIVEGLMRAAAMISYDSAARTLGFTELPPVSPAAEAFKKDLKHLATISSKLRRARMRRGALDLDLPEAKISLDLDGAPEGVHKRAYDPGIKKAYQVIEELMLLANELVARWLTERNVPAIYRIHGKPDEEKLAKLADVAELLGAPFEVEDMLAPKAVSKWLLKIADHPRKNVLEGLLLRSLKQAIYDVTNVGHFGLASDAYLHFTSPIRRYPDLLVHRSVKRILNGAKPDNSPQGLEILRTAATTSSTRERAAMGVEREVMDLYRALYMKTRLGEIFEGTVGSVVGSGVYVQIDEPFVDVLVRFESLGNERFELSDDELSLVAPRSGDRIILGDKMTIEIEDVSLLRRAVYGRRLAVYTQDHTEPVAYSERPALERRPPRRPSKPDVVVPARAAVGPRRLAKSGSAGRIALDATGHIAVTPRPKRSKTGRKGAPPVRGKKPAVASKPGSSSPSRSKAAAGPKGRGATGTKGSKKGSKKRR
jgi:ribonuclease R